MDQVYFSIIFKADKDEPFYIGLIKSISEKTINIQWCEHVSTSKKCRFGYGSFKLSWISKTQLNSVDIEKSSIIHSFKKLTGKDKLPKPVLQHLHTLKSLNWKMKTSFIKFLIFRK